MRTTCGTRLSRAETASVGWPAEVLPAPAGRVRPAAGSRGPGACDRAALPEGDGRLPDAVARGPGDAGHRGVEAAVHLVGGRAAATSVQPRRTRRRGRRPGRPPAGPPRVTSTAGTEKVARAADGCAASWRLRTRKARSTRGALRSRAVRLRTLSTRSARPTDTIFQVALPMKRGIRRTCRATARRPAVPETRPQAGSSTTLAPCPRTRRR